MKVVLEPVDKPRNGRSIYPWDEIRETLVSQPGQWIHVFSDINNTIAHRLRRGQIRGFDPDEFQWVTHNNKPNANGVRRCDVLGCYTPKEKDE